MEGERPNLIAASPNQRTHLLVERLKVLLESTQVAAFESFPLSQQTLDPRRRALRISDAVGHGSLLRGFVEFFGVVVLGFVVDIGRRRLRRLRLDVIVGDVRVDLFGDRRSQFWRRVRQ